MRILDALTAAKAGQKKKKRTYELQTVWSEQAASEAVPKEYPRPQMQRSEWICLNGHWHYAFTKKGNRPENFDGRILVPFAPESSRSGVGKKLHPGEYLWYFRSVEIPEVPKGKRLLLHFGAVDERCIVWWNGKLLGGHRGGYLSFTFDVTEQLHEGKNTIWVRVQDDTDKGQAARGKQTLAPEGMFYTAVSGIWQTVWLEWVPENYIENIKITPRFDEGEVKLELTMTEPLDVAVLVSGRWSSYLHQIPASSFVAAERGAEGRCSVYAGEQIEKVMATTVITLPEVHVWSPEDPFLYDLVIRAGEDTIRSYFALRKFSTGHDKNGIARLFLNNKPYFVNGVLDQGYWPESLYTPPCDEAMVFDITKMKELGFNMLRKHVKIEPMRWYYHCDRIGMLVWQDMVNGGGPLDLKRLCYLPTVLPPAGTQVKDSHYSFFARTDKQARAQWLEECIAAVMQLYNCPCIGMWVPFNEGWGQFDALRVTKKIKREDPTRLVDHASGWFDQGGGDIRSVHNYFRPLRVQKGRRPFVLSEYGGYSCPVPGHMYASVSYGYRSYQNVEKFAEAFVQLQKQIRALEQEGLAGAVYTQVCDVEEEINGLYTYDRKICKVKKRDADRIYNKK